MRLCLQFANMDQMVINYWFPHELGIKDSTSPTVTPLDAPSLTPEKRPNFRYIKQK